MSYASSTFLQLQVTLQRSTLHAALCIEAAGRDEARRAENWGRRPIIWQRSSGQVATTCPLVYTVFESCDRQ